MFEKFSDLSRRAVIMAQEVARGLNHDYIGTEHLLVALAELTESPKHLDPAKPADSLSRTILLSHEYTPETLRQEITPGKSRHDGHIRFSERATKALECARRESSKRGSPRIEDVDLLLGILRPDNQKPKAVEILTKLSGAETITVLRKSIAQRIDNVSVTPEGVKPVEEFTRILIPLDKIPEGGVKVIEGINDDLVGFSVEDLQRIARFVKESRLRIANY
jgi:ATP-dependent Clp protease ATP-binding subunit ClpC